MDYEILKKNFENHGFKTSYFKTKEEAAEYLARIIEGETVGFGGSMTAKEMKLYELLGEKNTVIWHWENPGRETLIKAQSSTAYILSANGVSETGELVNIDGTGNRLSASLYGPEHIYYIIGKNKIAPDLHSAIRRAKDIASTRNAMRFNADTPCVKNGGGKCFNCNSPARICHATVILERPMNGMVTELLFIDEELGF